jgi:hypothetical protein
MNKVQGLAVGILWVTAAAVAGWIGFWTVFLLCNAVELKDLDLAGYAALLGVVFALPKVKDFFEERRDQRVATALIKARNFAKALGYLTSPFIDEPIGDVQNKTSKDEQYRTQLYQDRSSKEERIKTEFRDFELVQREGDLYLSMDELAVIDDLRKLEIEATVGFRIFATFIGEGVSSREREEWWNQAFLQGKYKKRLEKITERLTEVIRTHNDRYRPRKSSMF